MANKAFQNTYRNIATKIVPKSAVSNQSCNYQRSSSTTSCGLHVHSACRGLRSYWLVASARDIKAIQRNVYSLNMRSRPEKIMEERRVRAFINVGFMILPIETKSFQMEREKEEWQQFLGTNLVVLRRRLQLVRIHSARKKSNSSWQEVLHQFVYRYWPKLLILLIQIILLVHAGDYRYGGRSHSLESLKRERSEYQHCMPHKYLKMQLLDLYASLPSP